MTQEAGVFDQQMRECRGSLVPFTSANCVLRISRSSDVEWTRPDLNQQPSGYPSARQRESRCERLHPVWDPDHPPEDALDRSFAWLAEIAYSEIARSSTENDLVCAEPFPGPGRPGPSPFHSILMVRMPVYDWVGVETVNVRSAVPAPGIVRGVF